MGYTQQMLDDVREQLAPDDAVLKEARARRDLARAAGESLHGTNRSFSSGSLAHGTANCPVHQRDKGLDADCGVVLDRRSHPALGPDSQEQDGPTSIVEQMRDHLRLKIARGTRGRASRSPGGRSWCGSQLRCRPVRIPRSTWSWAWSGATLPGRGSPTPRRSAGTHPS